MNSFRNHRLRDHTLPMSTAWLLNDIAEAKGKQELYTRQSPQVLKALREMALIQSTESSNRIEGVTVAADRLRPLVLGSTKPRDRSEQEVQGYRLAFNEIHTRHEKLPINAATLKHLHALCQAASGDAGQFKRIDNEVVELRPLLRRRHSARLSGCQPRHDSAGVEKPSRFKGRVPRTRSERAVAKAGKWVTTQLNG